MARDTDVGCHIGYTWAMASGKRAWAEGARLVGWRVGLHLTRPRRAPPQELAAFF